MLKKDVKYYLHSIIMLLIMFGFGYLPEIGSITDIGMKVLGVFLGLVYGWMFVDMLWPSFMGLVALGTTGYVTVSDAFAQGFGNSTFLQIFFFFIIASYATESGLSEKVAIWFLTRRFIAGKPWVFVIMLFLAAYILGIFIMTYAIIFFFWAILGSICDIVGYERKHNTAAFLHVGVLQMATLGGTVMPYQVFPKVCLNALNQATGLSIPSGKFIVYMIVISFVALVLYIIAGKILHVDVSKFKSLTAEQITNGRSSKFEKAQIISGSIVVGFTIVILLPLILPESFFLVRFYNLIGDFGCLIIAICIACALRFNEKSVADFATLEHKGVNWDLMALVAATMPMGAALASEDTNIIGYIVEIISPLFYSMSPVVIIVFSLILLGVTTQFAHNLILATTLIPLISSLVIEIGMAEQVALIIAAGGSQCLLAALSTPAASNRGALIYGYEWIGKREALKYGIIVLLTVELSMICVGIPLGFVML